MITKDPKGELCLFFIRVIKPQSDMKIIFTKCKLISEVSFTNNHL